MRKHFVKDLLQDVVLLLVHTWSRALSPLQFVGESRYCPNLSLYNRNPRYRPAVFKVTFVSGKE